MSNRNSATRLFPFSWPWKGVDNQSVSLKEVLLGRKFSILYLLIIWSIVGILDFGSTRNCTGTWQLALQCDYAIWLGNFTEAPLIYFRNLFTGGFLHNGLDHILFVSILGIAVVMQSYEIRFGFKETLFMFFLSYFVVVLIFGIIYNFGLYNWPESEFFLSGFERGWMGGSVALFFLYGALAFASRRPVIPLSIPFCFELVNHFILDIDIHISLIHLTMVTTGFLIKRRLALKGITLAPQSYKSR